MGKRFRNHYIRNTRRKSLDFLLLLLGYYQDILPHPIPPKDFTYPCRIKEVNLESPKVTWINHCTFLIDIYDLKILTDPLWSRRCSPISFIGPKRQHEPPFEIEDLEGVDIVLISHNHYDHLDLKTVELLHKRFPNIVWIVPYGLKKWFNRREIYQVRELQWWEEIELTFGKSLPKVTISSVPAQHNSGRTPFDQDNTLWMGIIAKISSEQFPTKTLYFVGDTAYNGYDFKKIGESFSPIDLCLCPIGTYKPENFMRTVHSSPQDAVNIHEDTKAKLSIGMHWKTFKLSSEHPCQPPYDLHREMKKRGLEPSTFIALDPGVTINW